MGLSGNYFIGIMYVNYFNALNNVDDNVLKVTEKEISNPLFYQNVSNHETIRENDNAIVCLFSLLNCNLVNIIYKHSVDDKK